MKPIADEIDKIRHATEDILETVGFVVPHPGLLRRARSAGASGFFTNMFFDGSVVLLTVW